MEKFGTTLYKACGISEWDEKRLFLSEEEQVEVLNSIKKGELTDLVKWVIMPYPKFVVEFFRKNSDLLEKRRNHDKRVDSYISGDALNNNELGYKLYLLSESQIRTLIKYVKYPELPLSSMSATDTSYETNTILSRLALSLEKSYILDSMSVLSRVNLKKYIHIMSYIDAKEAEKLGLTSFTFYSQGEYRGFDIENKLKSVNPLIRHILIRYLGLDGAFYTTTEISEELGVSISSLDTLLDIDFLLSLTKSCGEFRNSIKYLDKEYAPNERKEYAYVYTTKPIGKKPYSLVAEALELKYLKNHINDEKTKKNDKKTKDYIINRYASNISTMLEEEDLQHTM